MDLKNPRRVEILYRLVAKSDVFVQNFRKGVAERLRLGYEDLIKHNPKIVYGAATGYGPLGKDSGKPAFVGMKREDLATIQQKMGAQVEL